MKKFLVLTFSLLSFSLGLFACSASDSAETRSQASSAKVSRALRVSGYIARPDSTTGTYSASGELVAKNRVELRTETSGRLAKLYASDGERVSKGALVAKIDDSELRASLKSAEASLELAKKKEARTRALFEKDGATAEELESAENAVKQAEASKELLEAQRAKTEIRAPFSGKLGVIRVSEGAYMSLGAEIAVLVDSRELWTEFELPQRYSRALSDGDRVTLVDDELGTSVEAKVRFMDSEISNTSRTRKVRAILKNSDGKFIAGSFVRVNLAFGNGSETGTPIPSEAVTLDANGAYVFVAKAGKAEQVYVETGLRTPITVNVLRGLSAGDTVIVSGLMNLRNGMGIEVKEINNNMSYEAHE